MAMKMFVFNRDVARNGLGGLKMGLLYQEY